MAEEAIGRYKIQSTLGKGAMGVVYKAYDASLDRLVAIKVMSTSGEVDEELRTRFFREARSAARLNHPNIISIYEMDEDQNRPFIAMEYIDGDDLKTLIKKRLFVPFQQKLELIIQVCKGLHYAHLSGVIHRDIKPGNILITRDAKAKIVDFGLARIGSSEMTRTGILMGTPYYMSPEQVRGSRDLDGRSDLFSVGVILYELISYQRPFEADTPTAVCFRIVSEPHSPLSQTLEGCADELTQIIDRALCKDRQGRFANGEEFAQALEKFRLHLPDEQSALSSKMRMLQDKVEGYRHNLEILAVPGFFDESLLDPGKSRGDPDETVFGLVDSSLEVRQVDGDLKDYGVMLLRSCALQRHLELIAQRSEKAGKLRELLSRSRQQFEQDQLDGCLRTLREALQIHPDNPEAQHLQKECHRRVVELRQEQERSLRLNAALDIARKAFAQGNLERCLNAATSALSIAPGHEEALELQRSVTELLERRKRFETLQAEAQRCFDAQDYERCLKMTSEALQLEPMNAELSELQQTAQEALQKKEKIQALLKQARERLEKSEHATALKLLEELLALDPAHAEALRLKRSAAETLERRRKVDELLLLARGHEKAEDHEACRDTAAEALKLEPENSELQQLYQRAQQILEKRRKVSSLLAKAREELLRKQFSSALELIKNLLALEPQHTEAIKIQQAASEALERQRKVKELLAAARRYHKAEDYEACHKATSEALELEPEHAELKELHEQAQRALEAQRTFDSLLDQARKQLEHENHVEALKSLDELLKLAPSHSQALELKRYASRELEKFQRVKKAEELLVLARKHYESGDYEACFKVATDALELEPKHPELKQLQERARKALDEARKVNSLIEKARKHLKGEDYNAAVKALDQVLSVEPNHSQAADLKRFCSETLQRKKKIQEMLALAQRHFENQDYEACCKVAEQAFELEPEHPELTDLHQRAWQARVERRRAESERRDRIEELMEFARGEMEKERYQSALDNLVFLLELEPNHAAALALKRHAEVAMAKEPVPGAPDATVILDKSYESTARPRALPAKGEPIPSTLKPHEDKTLINTLHKRFAAGEVEPPPPVAATAEPPPSPPAETWAQGTAPPTPDEGAVKAKAEPILRQEEVVPAKQEIAIAEPARKEAATRLAEAVPRIPTGGAEIRTGFRIPWLAAGGAAAVAVAILVIISLFHGGKQGPVSPTDIGTLQLNISPWANVDSITQLPDGKTMQKDCPVTPCVVALPPGKYRVRVSNPYFKRLEFEVTVAAGQHQQVHRLLPDFSPDREIQ